mgnify:CR=1 FL=1
MSCADSFESLEQAVRRKSAHDVERLIGGVESARVKRSRLRPTRRRVARALRREIAAINACVAERRSRTTEPRFCGQLPPSAVLLVPAALQNKDHSTTNSAARNESVREQRSHIKNDQKVNIHSGCVAELTRSTGPWWLRVAGYPRSWPEVRRTPLCLSAGQASSGSDQSSRGVSPPKMTSELSRVSTPPAA